MTDNLLSQKKSLRAEAKRTRGLLSLDLEGHKKLVQMFYDSLVLQPNCVIACYWPKGRELDTTYLMDTFLDDGYRVALPIVEADSKVLKFGQWDHNTDMEHGAYDILQPRVEHDGVYLSPDVFIVPMLAFDRRGYRLGYGGGYYDATLSYYMKEKEVTSVGLAYAKQACLFNLPVEEHDVRMDWIITEQEAHQFS